MEDISRSMLLPKEETGLPGKTELCVGKHNTRLPENVVTGMIVQLLLLRDNQTVS